MLASKHSGLRPDRIPLRHTVACAGSKRTCPHKPPARGTGRLCFQFSHTSVVKPRSCPVTIKPGMQQAAGSSLLACFCRPAFLRWYSSHSRSPAPLYISPGRARTGNTAHLTTVASHAAPCTCSNKEWPPVLYHRLQCSPELQLAIVPMAPSAAPSNLKKSGRRDGPNMIKLSPTTGRPSWSFF